ncbi:MAG: hypothetical protein ACPGVG_12630, partial [Mycobacterium sp.]
CNLVRAGLGVDDCQIGVGPGTPDSPWECGDDSFREALNGAILGVAGVVDIGTTVPTDDISLTSEQIVSLSAATLSFTAA